jgi:acyl-CoA synthetase (AMP-forming)/AMP-acid ligase II
MIDLSATVAAMLDAPPAGEALHHDGRWRRRDWVARAARGLDAAIGSAAAVGLVARNRPHHLATYAANLAAHRPTVMLRAAGNDAGLAADIAAANLPAIVADRADWSAAALAAARRTGTTAIATDETGDGPTIELLSAGRGDGFRTIDPDVALELLSSGTTGAPKRVPLAWRTVAHAIETIAGAYPGSGHHAPQIMVHPLGTVAGLAYATPPLALGLPLVLLDRFAAISWARAVRDHRPVRATVPPVGVRMLLEADIPPDWLASLTLIAVGGGALDPALQIAFEARFGVPVLIAYGATEFGGVVANWSLDDYRVRGAAKRGSAGRASAGATLRIVDVETGALLPPDRVGRLEARVARMGPRWIATTDLAALDGDGFLFLHGRIDDAINRGGFKVVPDVVAAALRTHPAVADAAVAGLPDPRLGAVPVAVVELRTGHTATVEALTAWLRDRLPAYEVPVAMRIVDALPRNASMKVSRPDLLALFA